MAARQTGKRKARHHHHAKRRSAHGSLRPFAWFVGGFLLGGLVVGVAVDQIHLPISQHASTKDAHLAYHDKDSESKTTKPVFDFYTILPEMEIVVPQSGHQQAAETTSTKKTPAMTTHKTIPKPQAAPAPTPQHQTQAKAQYMLQIASLKKFADADQLKAELTLQGFDVTIQTVTLKNGETWHRVRSGPYASLTRAQDQRQRLSRQHINSLLLKLKG